MSAPTFDLAGFYAALNRAREARNVTWKKLGRETGVSETTLSRMKLGRCPDAASLAALSAWAGINPARFSPQPKQQGLQPAVVNLLADRVTAYQEDDMFCVTYRTPTLQRAKHIHGQVKQFVSLMDDEPLRTAPAAPAIATAAQNLLDAVDARQDNCTPPLKYTIPYGAVNDLRAALQTTGDGKP